MKSARALSRFRKTDGMWYLRTTPERTTPRTYQIWFERTSAKSVFFDSFIFNLFIIYLMFHACLACHIKSTTLQLQNESKYSILAQQIALL